MEKLYKVIAGLVACNGVGEDCKNCPYAGEGAKCSDILDADTLAVLQEMEGKYTAVNMAAEAKKSAGPASNEDAKRYLKCEIERVTKRLEDKGEIVYNGELVGSGVARRLNERHISFCKMVLSLLGEEVAE